MSPGCGYNSLVSQRRRLVFALIFMTILLPVFSCKKDINTKEAVQAAVMKRLSGVSGLNVDGMDIDISGISFQGEKAEAQVAFRAKGTTQTMMSMTYKLERKGEEWVVTSSSGGFGGGGGMGGGQVPPGHGPAGEQDKK